jgi:hypothetical protein
MGYFIVFGKRKNWNGNFVEYGELVAFKCDKFELMK